MTGEFYFMALGGLGVSLAGFAGLIAALDSRPDGHAPVARWRIRNIVVAGFSVTFVGFGTIALHTVAGDEELTARIMSGLIAVLGVLVTFREGRPGSAWPDEGRRRVAQAFTVLGVLVALGNVVIGRVGYLQFLVLGMLITPVTIFIFTVRDLDEPSGPGERLGELDGSDD